MRVSELLNEGLIQSVTREKFKTTLERRMPDAKLTRDGKTMSLDFKSEDFSNAKYEKLAALLRVLGWYVASCSLDKPHQGRGSKVKQTPFDYDPGGISKFYQIVSFNVEPVYDEAVRIPTVLYHAAPESVVPKILKVGLVPRAGAKKANHPDRVYVTITKGAATVIKNIFGDEAFERGKKPPKMVILKIDKAKLPKGTKFYIDPNYKDGVYTTKNIPPDAISVL